MKVAIIGFGKMGRIRAANFEKLGWTVFGVSDIEDYGGHSYSFFSDPDHLVNHAEVDAICICTPNFLIKPLTIKSLDAGKHVFSEKPPGISLHEVFEMRDCLNAHPALVLKFGFNHRYHEAIIEAKRRAESGHYGKIIWMRGRYGKSVDEGYQAQWRAKKELAGGGIFLDQGIHMLDLFLHFCDDFQEVKSFCSGSYWDLGIEDNVFAMFRNKEGQTASLHSTMTQWRHLFSLEIFMERGYMVVNGILSSSGSYTNGTGYEELSIALNRTPAPQAAHTEEERLKFGLDRSFQKEVDDFVASVQSGKSPEYGTIQDAEKLMRLVEMVYEDDQQWGGAPEGK